MDQAALLSLLGNFYDKLVQDVAAKVFEMSRMIEQPAYDYDRLLADVRANLDYSEFVVDLPRLAGYLDVNEIASEIDLNDLAGSISLDDLAGEFDLSDLAGELDMSDLASTLVSDGDLGPQVADLMKSKLHVGWKDEA
jgi:hypothetical protein